MFHIPFVGSPNSSPLTLFEVFQGHFGLILWKAPPEKLWSDSIPWQLPTNNGFNHGCNFAAQIHFVTGDPRDATQRHIVS